jgi:NhaP-type Na+/H+ or K+/H+ antiporter
MPEIECANARPSEKIDKKNFNLLLAWAKPRGLGPVLGSLAISSKLGNEKKNNYV